MFKYCSKYPSILSRKFFNSSKFIPFTKIQSNLNFKNFYFFSLKTDPKNNLRFEDV